MTWVYKLKRLDQRITPAQLTKRNKKIARRKLERTLVPKKGTGLILGPRVWR